MTDFHIHIDSLLPSEALHYAACAGLRAVCLVLRLDDASARPLASLAESIRQQSLYANIQACLGVELVHVSPALLPDSIAAARLSGADLVMVHGESLADSVEPGTNFAACLGQADILFHPGLVDEKTAELAAESGTAFEISTCPKHALTNAHVLNMADSFGVSLLPGSNARTLQEILPPAMQELVFKGCGMNLLQKSAIYASASRQMQKIMLGNTKKKSLYK